jgi:hypothetical protein
VRWESVTPDPIDGQIRLGRPFFLANQLRFGATQVPGRQVVLEGATRVGRARRRHARDRRQPSPGANYYQYTPEADQGATVLRQAYVTAQSDGFGATLGRFEWGEGVETLPTDADLLWLKRTRITERLVGPFGYTHAARTFDGARLWYDRPTWNATGVAVRPTAGGFEVEAGEQLEEVSLLGFSASTKSMPWNAPADGRAFWFHYEDERVEDGRPVRVDNRPAGARAADSTMIRFDTFGMNLATVLGLGAARLDGLGWAAWQRGDWGRQDHSAFAYAIEVGVHWPKWWGSPWLRAGVNVASGDADAADDTHGTFVPLLTTTRIYALTPFYTAMNLDDRFVQLIVKPLAKVTVRLDYHDLRLAESTDLWYSGGGAVKGRLRLRRPALRGQPRPGPPDRRRGHVRAGAPAERLRLLGARPGRCGRSRPVRRRGRDLRLPGGDLPVLAAPPGLWRARSRGCIMEAPGVDRARRRQDVIFRDRIDAAQQLAAALDRYRGQGALVLAIPRGGVPMGRVIADALQAELDVVPPAGRRDSPSWPWARATYPARRSSAPRRVPST